LAYYSVFEKFRNIALNLDLAIFGRCSRICHPERSEGSPAVYLEILRFAQDDSFFCKKEATSQKWPKSRLNKTLGLISVMMRLINLIALSKGTLKLMKKITNCRIFGLFVFIIFSWGLAWPINKVGLDYLSPTWYTAIRLIIGTATMMILVIALRKFALPQRKDYPLILIIGLLQISIYILLANIGLNYLPAGRSSLLAYTTPLWVMPATVFIYKEEAGWLRWLGFSLGLAGLFLLLSPWEMDWTDRHIIFGSAMLLLASLSWAISMLCARYMHWTKSPLELIPWQLLAGTLPILLLAWIEEPNLKVVWNLPLILSLAYTGILVTGLSYWCGLIINKELPPIVASLGFLLVPVFSLIISAIFMHESINLATATAMMLIIVGLVCVVA
jgi:drug/metabolite transporter (DMT)-like permease